MFNKLLTQSPSACADMYNSPLFTTLKALLKHSISSYKYGESQKPASCHVGGR